MVDLSSIRPHFVRFQRPLVIRMSSSKKILTQRTTIEDTELEELVVNGVAEVEGLAKAEKWDGRRLLATPIHKMAETGAIASSQWCLMVCSIIELLFYTTIILKAHLLMLAF